MSKIIGKYEFTDVTKDFESSTFFLGNYIGFDPIIVGIQKKRPNRNALRICSTSPLD